MEGTIFESYNFIELDANIGCPQPIQSLRNDGKHDAIVVHYLGLHD